MSTKQIAAQHQNTLAFSNASVNQHFQHHQIHKDPKHTHVHLTHSHTNSPLNLHQKNFPYKPPKASLHMHFYKCHNKNNSIINHNSHLIYFGIANKDLNPNMVWSNMCLIANTRSHTPMHVLEIT